MKTIMQPVKPHTLPVRELNGELLNWAVAQAVGQTVYRTKRGEWMTAKYEDFDHRRGIPYWRPRLDWLQAGRLIEKHKISIWPSTSGWYAESPDGVVAEGDYLLTAALRCIVASVFGDEIPIPEGVL